MTQTLDLEKMELQALPFEDLSQIEGGWRFPWKQIERAINLLGLGDAIDRFMDGWNSVECNCK